MMGFLKLKCFFLITEEYIVNAITAVEKKLDWNAKSLTAPCISHQIVFPIYTCYYLAIYMIILMKIEKLQRKSAKQTR